jgi:hypothetical protein
MSTLETNLIQPATGTTLTVGASGDQITAATGVKTSFLYPAFQAYLSSAQSISDGVTTKVEIDTEDFDTGGMYDNSTNYRFTPTVAGKYMAYGSTVGYAGAVTDVVSSQVLIYKNGSYYAGSEENYNGNFIQRSYNVVTAIIDMNGSSDYLELFGYVNGNSGGGEEFSVTGGARGNIFGAYRIGT